MKKSRKILAVLLTVLMTLSVFQMNFVFAENEPTEGECGDNLTWAIDSDDVLTVSGEGDMYAYEQQKTPWYPFRTTVKTIVISDGVTSVGENAFFGFSRATKIRISDSVKNIYPCAFQGCVNIRSIVIPDETKSLGRSSFEGCTSLSRITLGSSLNSIGRTAFYNTEYYDNEANWDEGALYIGKYLVDVDNDKVGEEYSVKDGTACIADYAFYKNSTLKELTLPDSLVSIGYYTFSFCNELETVTTGTALEKISDYCFFGCRKLRNFEIPSSVNYIGSNAFYSCRCLRSVEIPANVSSIGVYAFYNCDSLSQLIINEGVETIEDGAFYKCLALEEVTIPESVSKIGVFAFFNCASLETVKIKNATVKCSDSGIGTVNIKFKGTAEDVNDLADKYEEGELTFENYEAKKNAMTEALEKNEDVAKLYIHGRPGSPSEQFAESHGFIFVQLSADGHEHVFKATLTTRPTCTEEGVMTYKCKKCSVAYTEAVEATGHVDRDGDEICDICEYDYNTVTPENCTCLCHKTGIISIVWKLLVKIYKLFKIETKQTCACGEKHWK